MNKAYRREWRKSQSLKECSHIEGQQVSSKDKATLTHRMENRVKISPENPPLKHTAPKFFDSWGREDIELHYMLCRQISPQYNLYLDFPFYTIRTPCKAPPLLLPRGHSYLHWVPIFSDIQPKWRALLAGDTNPTRYHTIHKPTRDMPASSTLRCLLPTRLR